MQKNVKSKKPTFKTNEDIQGYDKVRLVGDNVPNGVYPFSKALEMAQNEGLDLVLISETALPPIVRIVQFDKFLYDLKKREKERKKNATQLKEVQLSVDIAQHDLETKQKRAAEFLEHGDKVRVVLSMKGRQLSRREESKKSLYIFLDNLSSVARIDSLKDEGNKTIAILSKKGQK